MIVITCMLIISHPYLRYFANFVKRVELLMPFSLILAVSSANHSLSNVKIYPAHIHVNKHYNFCSEEKCSQNFRTFKLYIIVKGFKSFKGQGLDRFGGFSRLEII